MNKFIQLPRKEILKRYIFYSKIFASKYKQQEYKTTGTQQQQRQRQLQQQQQDNDSSLVVMPLRRTGIRTVCVTCHSTLPPHPLPLLKARIIFAYSDSSLCIITMEANTLGYRLCRWPMTGRIKGRRGQGVTGSRVHRKLTAWVLQISGVMSMP